MKTINEMIEKLLEECWSLSIDNVGNGYHVYVKCGVEARGRYRITKETLEEAIEDVYDHVEYEWGFKSEEEAWYEHWILDLLPSSIIKEKSFEEWMDCPDRYTEEQLKIMKDSYNIRGVILGSINKTSL